jgi:hypothetical protein
MKAWLVLQEGPGAGNSYPLDPSERPTVSVGRSSECDVVLDDHRASRHHGDIRWNNRQWEVIDRGSTNGTYVNGLQVHQPYELQLGDRITIGETTMVMRQTASGTARPSQLRPAGRAAETQEGRIIPGPLPAAAPRAAARTSTPGVAFWLAQGITILAVILLAAGAFLPWLKVTGSLSQDLQPLVQSLANIVASMSGSESIFYASQTIGGLEGYGKLTLAIAIISTLGLVVDLFFYRKSMVPGIVYLVAGFITAGAIGFDLVNYYQHYQQLKDLTLLLGVELLDVVQVFDRFIEVTITPQIGVFFTAAGLVLLLVGGTTRLVVGLLKRSG